jgi:pimeloyl-ACP methyl ester carboxylesterase
VALGFLDAIAPGERFALVGVSYGGYLGRGVIHARRAQIDGALLWTPVVETDTARRDLPAHRVFERDPDLLAILAPDESLWTQVSVMQTPAMLAEFRTAVKPGFQAADREFLGRVAQRYAFSFDVDALPEPFPAPVLILAGRQDAQCGYREAWKLLDNFPRGTFAVLDRAGHGLASEQRPLFRALVSEWLDRVEEYAGQR